MDINAILDMIDDDYVAGSNEENLYGLVTFLQNNKKPRNVPTLKSICITTIAKNISCWMEYLPENFKECLYFVNPFDILGTSEILRIMKILVDMKIFRYEHLHLLLHYKLSAIDFSILSKHGVSDSTLKTVFSRCKRIKDLTIPPGRLSKKTLNLIPEQYPALEYLKIHREVCQYDFIDLLATHCKKLKLLLLKVCVNIHDDAFERIKDCTSLNSLSLYHAENMTCSTFQVIIMYLTKLNQLSLVGCKMNFSSFNENNITYDNLVSIDLSWSNVTDYGLRQIISRMKNLAEVYLSRCQNLTTMSFKSLANLENLHRLAIGYFSRNYEFDSNVELCLLRIGMNLQYLDLSGMPRIHTNIIAMCCPNLKTLYLNHCLYPSIDWLRLNNRDCKITKFNWLSNTKDYFSLMEVCRRLEQLSISCMHLTYDNIDKLLCNSHTLKKLKFLPWSKDSLVSITEDFFIKFFNEFHFENLEELDVSRNNGVTKNVVLLILQLYPRLTRLQLVSCDLTTQELTSIKEIVKAAELDIII